MSEKQTIVSLEAENIKRLRAVRLEVGPEGLILVGGRNAQGKSSLLDSIAMALGGKTLCPERPIRDGEESGVVKIELASGLVVERRFTQSGTTLKITSKDGEKFSSPQGILDRMIGSLTFDPLEFSEAAPKKQIELLTKATGIDSSDLDTERVEIYAKRTEVGREVSRLEGHLRTLRYVEGIPDEPPDISDLTEKLMRAERKNREIERSLEDVEDHEANVKALKKELEAACLRLEASQKRFSSLGEREDTEAIEEEIAGLSRMREDCLVNRQHRTTRKDLDEQRAVYAILTDEIFSIDAAKAERLSMIEKMIPGLSMSEDGILLGGVPWTQASSSERLKVSMRIGMMLSGDLKVLLIHEGSLLDSDGIQDLADFAEETGCQIWVERVGTDGEMSVIIEDGEAVIE